MRRSGGLILEPSQGEIPAAASGDEGCVTVTAVLSVESVGALSGEVSLFLQGSEEAARKVVYSATGVKHTFNLVESGGVLVSEVRARAGRAPMPDLHPILALIAGAAGACQQTA